MVVYMFLKKKYDRGQINAILVRFSNKKIGCKHIISTLTPSWKNILTKKQIPIIFQFGRTLSKTV